MAEFLEEIFGQQSFEPRSKTPRPEVRNGDLQRIGAADARVVFEIAGELRASAARGADFKNGFDDLNLSQFAPPDDFVP